MKTGKSNILITFLLIFCSSFSQVRLEGNIISGRTKLKPSESVLIFPVKSFKGTFTDSIGNFVLDNLEFNKTYILKTSSIELGNAEIELKTGNDSIIRKTFEIISDCKFNSETAETDWKNKNPKLLLIGSIAPIGNSRKDRKFEERYKIKYYDFGCTPEALECIIEYNETIIKFMNIKYGKKWKSGIRKDVILN